MSMVGEKSWEITTDMALVGQPFNYGFYNPKYIWLHFNEMILNFTDFKESWLKDNSGLQIKCHTNMTLANNLLKGKQLVKVIAHDNIIRLIFGANLEIVIDSPEKAVLEDILDDSNDYCGG